MMIKAVLWDLDGVLVDTGSFHFEAWRELFESEGKEISEEEFRRTFGLRNDAILRDVLGDLPPQKVAELSRRKEEIFRAKIAGRITPIPGVVTLLQRLRQAGKRMAVVSSAPRQNVETMLHGLEIEDAFEVIIAEEDASRGKPDPQGYLLAAERLGVAPSECVVIEDAPGGVEAAKRAGIRCLGLAAERAPETLSAADLVVLNLEEEGVYRFLEI
jgi:HAD superfamily hydrolase (TIGR01509 family)